MPRISFACALALCACGDPGSAPVAQTTAELGASRFAWVARNLAPPASAQADLCAADSARDALICVTGNGGTLATLSHPLAPERVRTWQRFDVGPAEDENTYVLGLIDFPARARVVAFSSVAGLLTPWQWDGAAWTPQFRADAPAADTYSGAYAYDPAGRVLLYGGVDAVQWSGRTLFWDGDRWTRGADGPVGIVCPTAAYDESSSSLLVVGEDEGTTRTLRWSGGAWVDVPAAIVPEPTQCSTQIVAEPTTHRPLLMATVDGQPMTWELVQDAWIPRALPNPDVRPDRYRPLVDVARGHVLLERGHWQLDAQGFHALTPDRPGGAVWSAAYDSVRSEVVLTGRGPEQRIQHWTRASATGIWTRHPQVPTQTYAVNYAQTRMVYDAAGDRLVQFSQDVGSDPNRDPQRTQFFENGVWSDGPNVPSLVYDAAMTYDTAGGFPLLQVSYPAATVYRLQNDAWVPHASASPQRPEQIAYDSARQVVVAPYNVTSAAVYRTAIQTLSGGAWSTQDVPENNPGYRSGAALVYDPSIQQTWIVGGQNEAASAWNGSAWNKRTYGPGPRNGVAGVYDAARGSVLAFDGDELLWELRDTQWIQREPVFKPTTVGPNAYDPIRKRMVMFGYDRRTYEWDGSSWFELAGPVEYEAENGSLIWVPDAQGGSVQRFHAAGVHRWTGASWELVSATPSPLVTAYDPIGHRVIALRNDVTPTPAADGGSTFDSQTIGWDGAAWTVLGPAPRNDGGLARTGHLLVTDDTRERVVLHGGRDVRRNANEPGVMQNDTWEWDGAGWTQVAVGAAAPLPRTNPFGRFVPGLGVVLHGGANPIEYTVLRDLWSWDGTAWSLLLGTAPGSTNGSYLARDEAGAVLFGFSNNQIGQYALVSHGESCTTDAECPGAFCTDGVCCSSKSCGPCETCSGTSPGACSAVLNAEDPDTCPASAQRSCNAVGACGSGFGAVCTNSAQCGVGQCVDGVCCDSACDATCESCRASDNVAARDGICSPVRAGIDPRDVCPDDGVASCQRNGTCDGQRACANYPTTTCGLARCEGDQLVTPGQPPTSCNGYGCAGNACKTTCTTLADCADGFLCAEGGTCIAQESAPASDSGCACDLAPSAPGGGWAALGVLAALAAHRSRVLRRGAPSRRTAAGSGPPSP